MATARATPPADAVVLFAGKHLQRWETREGGPAAWKVEGGFLEVIPGAGDIRTQQEFTDFYLHLEFRCPHQRHARGQGRGNSGVFLQGRYELQILDSYGVDQPTEQDCGAIYGQFAPLINASRPAMVWQSFDVVFRSARKEAPARVTVLQNEQVIHNNLILPHPTASALDDRVTEPGPILLQDHGDPVAFRWVWVVPLPGSA